MRSEGACPRSGAFRRRVPVPLVVLVAALLAGCGLTGGTGDTFLGVDLDEDVRHFWALDMSAASPGYYDVPVIQVGEGARCRIYRALTVIVPDNAVRGVALAFDNVIYPKETTAFGSEPNPSVWDVDGDPKIAIVLLDIRDDFATTGRFVGGYFDPVNEKLPGELVGGERSNAREMIYLDARQLDPASLAGLRTLAHQFQHMIHWMQKDRLRGVHDESWLDEAMAQAAHLYCGYPPDYGTVAAFELAPHRSLAPPNAAFNDNHAPTGFMWAAYMRDQFDNTFIDNSFRDNSVFWDIMHSPAVGIASVEDALSQRGTPGLDFAGTFRNWSVAVASGSRIVWDGHPEWSYKRIDTAPGVIDQVRLPGILNAGNADNSVLRPLDAWSVDYYWFKPSGGNPGSFTWNPTDCAVQAFFYYDNAATLHFGGWLAPFTDVPYWNTGVLALSNPTPNAAGGGQASFPPVGAAPRERFREAIGARGSAPADGSAPPASPRCGTRLLEGGAPRPPWAGAPRR